MPSFNNYKVDRKGRHVYDKQVYESERDQEKIRDDLVTLADGDEHLVEEALRACQREVAVEVRGGFLWLQKKVAVHLETHLGDVVRYIVKHRKPRKAGT